MANSELYRNCVKIKVTIRKSSIEVETLADPFRHI